MASHPYTNLSPGDAAVAVRSFGRRFRDAASAASAASLDEEPDAAELDEIAARAGADGLSALDHIALAAERLEQAAPKVRAALVDSAHRVPAGLLAIEPGNAPTHSGQLETELARLERAGIELAQVIDKADAGQWSEQRDVDSGGSARPIDVVQATVAHVLDRLRGVERVLREVRGRPS